MFANIITPHKVLSFKERRRLASPPVFSIEQLLNGQVFVDYEQYLLDQFVLRDKFRGVKALASLYLFGQKDYNGLYVVGDGIYKMEYPLKEKSVLNAAVKFNDLYDTYLQDMNVHYAVIPDKNYFAAAPKGYLTIDYEDMIDILNWNVKHMSYIDLFPLLSIDDYYRTDIHWSQDRIVHVAKELSAHMGANYEHVDLRYEKQELYPFYGTFHGQSALPLAPDTIVYLTNEIINNAIVYDYEKNTYGKVYNVDKFCGTDAYDIFLSGAKPLLTITNPDCKGGSELILFRDSFGSSLAPLLLQYYTTITLVDLRYISSKTLSDYIDFTPDQDVLFLYSTLVINNSWMLK